MSRANLVDNKNKLLIRLNYKCASSNILKWFRASIKGYQHTDLILSGIINKKYISSPKKIGSSIYNGYNKVVIVRNPFNRVVSAFLDKGFNNNGPLSNLCKRHGTTINDLTFRKFMLILKYEDPKKMNGHWKPLMCDLKLSQYHKIIKMEFIGNHLNTLARKYGYKKFGIKPKKTGFVNVNLVDIPIKELQKLPPKEVKYYINYYDDETIKIVNSVYAADLKGLNYSYKKFIQNL
jgi:hypothetical protein